MKVVNHFVYGATRGKSYYQKQQKFPITGAPPIYRTRSERPFNHDQESRIENWMEELSMRWPIAEQPRGPLSYTYNHQHAGAALVTTSRKVMISLTRCSSIEEGWTVIITGYPSWLYFNLGGLPKYWYTYLSVCFAYYFWKRKKKKMKNRRLLLNTLCCTRPMMNRAEAI